MSTTDARMSNDLSRMTKAILLGGLVAGLLDGLDAVFVIGILGGVPVIRVFQFIASGLFGARAFAGGAETAFIGCVIHFFIATVAAATYGVLSRFIRPMRRNPFTWGPLFGVALFGFMHYIVVPLSAAPKQPPLDARGFANLVLAHIFCVGLPIALITNRFQPQTGLTARRAFNGEATT